MTKLKLKRCKYCGKLFKKQHNREMYCCDDCRKLAHQDQCRENMRKMRRLTRTGERVSNGDSYLHAGTGWLGCHMLDNEADEHAAVSKQLISIGLKRYTDYRR